MSDAQRDDAIRLMMDAVRHIDNALDANAVIRQRSAPGSALGDQGKFQRRHLVDAKNLIHRAASVLEGDDEGDNQE